jgi:hypothetical protein
MRDTYTGACGEWGAEMAGVLGAADLADDVRLGPHSRVGGIPAEGRVPSAENGGQDHWHHVLTLATAVRIDNFCRTAELAEKTRVLRLHRHAPRAETLASGPGGLLDYDLLLDWHHLSHVW